MTLFAKHLVIIIPYINLIDNIQDTCFHVPLLFYVNSIDTWSNSGASGRETEGDGWEQNTYRSTRLSYVAAFMPYHLVNLVNFFPSMWWIWTWITIFSQLSVVHLYYDFDCPSNGEIGRILDLFRSLKQWSKELLDGRILQSSMSTNKLRMSESSISHLKV